MKLYLFYLYSYIMVLSAFKIKPLKAGFCLNLNCLTSFFDREPNNPALLFVKKHNDIQLQQQEYDSLATDTSISYQFFYACPAQNRIENSLNSDSVTKNSLFVKRVETSNELEFCKLAVTPSIIQRNENFYTTGFEVYLGGNEMFENVYERDQGKNMPSNAFGWFAIAEIKFISTELRTNYIFCILYGKSSTNQEEHTMNNSKTEIYPYDIKLGENLFEKIDMEKLYADFNRNFIDSEDEDLYKEKILEMEFLVDLDYFNFDLHKNAVLTFTNVVPMWRTIRYGSWKTLNKLLRKGPKEDDNLLITTGTYGTLELPNTGPIFLSNDKIPVPFAFWKFIRRQFKQLYLEIFIVIHNNPFETNPEMLCEKNICQQYGWNEFNNSIPKTGFAYCCRMDEKIIEAFNLPSDLSVLKDKTPRSVLKRHNLKGSLSFQEILTQAADID